MTESPADKVQRLKAELKDARQSLAAERQARRVDCPVCGQSVTVSRYGTLRSHATPGVDPYVPPFRRCKGGTRTIDGVSDADARRRARDLGIEALNRTGGG